MNNYAFIDAQNLSLTLREYGWKVDWRKFLVYLREKHSVRRAYLFFGYLRSNEWFYRMLEKFRYRLIFKEVFSVRGEIKGNIDAELVLQAMIDFEKYDRALIVTNDGDFSCLVNYLYENKKLQNVLAPNIKTCSVLLKRSARGRMDCLFFMRNKLCVKK